MDSNITGFHHFAIKAQHFLETVAFYETLNFEVVHTWSLPEFNLEKCVMMKNTAFDCYIEICDHNADFPTQGRKREQNEAFVENAIMHLCFSVKDAELAYNNAIKNGAKPLSEKETIDLVNNIKCVTVKNSLVYSPNGEVIEFLETVAF